MKLDAKAFRVKPGDKVNLDERPTSVKPFYKSKKACHKHLAEQAETLSSLQLLHYAPSRLPRC